MISQYPAKFGDHRHCGNADIMLLVVEEENFRCSRHIILLTPILVTHTQSSWTKIESNFSQSVQKHGRERERVKKERQLQSVLR